MRIFVEAQRPSYISKETTARYKKPGTGERSDRHLTTHDEGDKPDRGRGMVANARQPVAMLGMS